jgi:hypothetical protein
MGFRAWLTRHLVFVTLQFRSRIGKYINNPKLFNFGQVASYRCKMFRIWRPADSASYSLCSIFLVVAAILLVVKELGFLG